jgi:hypothetical protein
MRLRSEGGGSVELVGLPMEYTDHISALRADYSDLADAFGLSDSVENVLDWMQSRDLPPGAIDLIGQDEFSYDFLIRLDEKRWPVFGVN